MNKDYKIALENATLPEEISKKYEMMKCYMCKKKLDYEIYATNTGHNILTCDAAYKGKRFPVCKKCFRLSVFFNDIVFIFVKLIARFL